MKSLIVSAFATLFCVALLAAWLTSGSGAAPTPNGDPNPRPKKHLKAFSSEGELKKFLKKIVKKRGGTGSGSGTGDGTGNAATPPPGVPDAKAVNSTVEVTAAGGGGREEEPITNTQHAGVDEGGIVKMHGDHLVVLRRGRLFTIAIGDSSLKPVSAVNAFGPDIDPDGTWYDEMLISDDNIVVIGYSYDRGGTEVGLFKIDRKGGLKYRSTYHLRSNDYYSSRNYSSRLIGNKLIFYSPLYLDLYEDDLFDSFPALRKWHKGAKASEFRRIVSARNVYRVEQGVDYEDEIALHTVTTCDLSSNEMTCDAASILGPPGHVFYVSGKSVYVWAAAWASDDEKERNRSMLFRMPLDGAAPSAVRVSGSPVDQFSFLEGEENDLNVLVRSESTGDGMWSAEVSEGEVALLRVNSNEFADGSTAAPASSYRELEKVSGYTFQNRFVGDYLLYGLGSGWGLPSAPDETKLYVVNWKTEARTAIPLSHSVDRLDALASDGIVVGTKGDDLFFTSVRLDKMPRVVDTYSIKDASQGETRSQGFFYKPDGADTGVLGLPITGGSRPGYKQLREGSASIIFLKNNSLRFNELGRLVSESVKTPDDDCKASCVDWYGNARPIFARGRIFALLGYEIVEGSLRSNDIEEVRRVDFSPRLPAAAAR